MKFEEFNKEQNGKPKTFAEPEMTFAPVVLQKNGVAVDDAVSDLRLDVLQNNLDNCLQIIDEEVMKGYIKRLNELEIVDPDKIISPKLSEIQFFRITELVYEQDEFSVHKLASVFHALSNKPCTLVLMIKSRVNSNNIYLGVRSDNPKNSTGTMRTMLCQSLLGQFPGSKVEEYTLEMLESDIDFDNRHKLSESVSVVTSIADYKQEKERVTNTDFIQGLEKYIYSIQGKNVTSIFIANNIDHDELIDIRNDYENIYTQISPFAEMQYNFTSSNTSSNGNSHTTGIATTQTNGDQISYSESDSCQHTMTDGINLSYTATDAEGASYSLSEGASKTFGTTDTKSSSTTESNTISESKSKTKGGNHGISFLGLSGGRNKSKSKTYSKSYTNSVTEGFSRSENISDTISHTLTHGMNKSHSDAITTGSNKSITQSDTITTGTQIGINNSVSESVNSAYTDIFSDTFGNTTGVTLNAKNRTIISILERLDKQLERLNECESLGMWNLAAYFVGEVMADTETAANTYYSLMSGNKTGIERSAVNTWTNEEDINLLKKYINNFVHPRFSYNGFDYNTVRNVLVTPTSMVSTNELAIHMALPRHSVKGLPVIEHAIFAQEVLAKVNENSIDIGRIYHLGKTTDERVLLDSNSLSMHTFITGSTGSGKSNAVYTLINKAGRKGVKFLVIEPAKGEYKHIFGNNENVFVYGTNPLKSPLLKINPFSFPDDIHVLEHLDRLIDIFNVCWPMYAAMPAILKSAIEKSYKDCGWDLSESANPFGSMLYPNFADVARNVKLIIDNSEYDAENKGAYKGSLLTRLNSLITGINGMLFNDNELDSKCLFDENVIVDLSRVGSNETKSLIMGILVLKLQEYRMSSSAMNAPLKHLTVLEEAHNLLKRTSAEQSSDSANLAGKSVEMISNAIAEMRTYGEGFIIADQAPGLLDMAAIRNTNTKIILRLPDESDRELVGKSANLDDVQIIELSKLSCGVAAIYQNEWRQPILCKIDKFKDESKEYIYHRPLPLPKADYIQDRLQISKMLSNGVKVDAETIRSDIIPILKNIEIPASKEVEIIKLLSNPPKKLRMTKLAPIICSLFPSLLEAMRDIYSETHFLPEWTECIENTLLDTIQQEIDNQTRRDIIQSVVTHYLLNVINDSSSLKKWSEKGGLK